MAAMKQTKPRQPHGPHHPQPQTGTSPERTTTPLPPIVLVVEDDADTRELYEVVLASEGFWVATADDAVEAFEYAIDIKPDAVVADLGLPGRTNGAELVQQLRAEPSLERVPILVVSGWDPSKFGEAQGLPSTAFVRKPIEPDDLVLRVRGMIAAGARLPAA